MHHPYTTTQNRIQAHENYRDTNRHSPRLPTTGHRTRQQLPRRQQRRRPPAHHTAPNRRTVTRRHHVSRQPNPNQRRNRLSLQPTQPKRAILTTDHQADRHQSALQHRPTTHLPTHRPRPLKRSHNLLQDVTHHTELTTRATTQLTYTIKKQNQLRQGRRFYHLPPHLQPPLYQPQTPTRLHTQHTITTEPPQPSPQVPTPNLQDAPRQPK